MHEYVCLQCGRFFQGDEKRRSINTCEECEEDEGDPDKRMKV